MKLSNTKISPSLFLFWPLLLFIPFYNFTGGFPGNTSSKESPPAKAGDVRDSGEFNPWVGKIPWNRTLQPTSVFLPEKFHGQRSLAYYCPWGCKESDTSKGLSTHRTHIAEANFFL